VSEARRAWSSQYNGEETRAGGYGWRYQAITLTIRVWSGLVFGGITGHRMMTTGRSLRSYNDLAGRNGSGYCGDATIPRDIPVGYQDKSTMPLHKRIAFDCTQRDTS
jgi:hypothetical protein